jgi:hypothetical protein
VVTLGCNIHDNMMAYILVTAAPYFGRTDAGGHWHSPALSNGRYRVRLWHPSMSEPGVVERIVEVGDERVALEIRLSKNLRPAPLTGRPHSWDY